MRRIERHRSTDARLIAAVLCVVMLLGAGGCSLKVVRSPMSGVVVDRAGAGVSGATIRTIDIGTVPIFTTTTDNDGLFKIPRRTDGFKGPVNTYIQSSFKVPPLLLVTTPDGMDYLFWSRWSWNRSRVSGPTRLSKAPEYRGDFRNDPDASLTEHYPEVRGATNIYLNDFDWPGDNQRIILRLLDDEN